MNLEIFNQNSNIDTSKLLKKTDKALKRLISEEWLASHLYEQMILACPGNERPIITDIFSQIEDDEHNDHYSKLINFALANTIIDIPCKVSEYERYADEKLVRIVNKMSKGKDVKYYIDLALESEELAINTYSEILNDENVLDDVKRLILEMYYDEVDHLSTLKSLSIANNIGSKINF